MKLKMVRIFLNYGVWGIFCDILMCIKFIIIEI